MTFTSARFAAIVLASALSLTACEDFEGLSGADETDAQAVVQLGPDGARTEVRDVERPDIFSTSENGLWDGRPSLGGIWVAHPDVTDPERARITNTSNGKTIEGALFRRERANPGPRIQVSSDAATALGLLAGQPTELKIVAVRREEIELEPEPLPIADEAGDTTPADTEEAEAGSAVAATAVAASASASAAEAPKRKGFWARFRDSLRNEPADNAKAEALTDETTADSAAVPTVETATLDPVTTAAAAAISESESEKRPAPANRAPTSGLDNPFIQVGLFGREENASAVAANLRQAGIVPQIRGQKSGGKTLWRVYVGPMTSSDDQAALLGQVKRLGYTDAFLAPS